MENTPNALQLETRQTGLVCPGGAFSCEVVGRNRGALYALVYLESSPECGLSYRSEEQESVRCVLPVLFKGSACRRVRALGRLYEEVWTWATVGEGDRDWAGGECGCIGNFLLYAFKCQYFLK